MYDENSSSVALYCPDILFSFLSYISSGARPALPMGVSPETTAKCLHLVVGSTFVILINSKFFLSPRHLIRNSSQSFFLTMHFFRSRSFVVAIFLFRHSSFSQMMALLAMATNTYLGNPRLMSLNYCVGPKPCTFNRSRRWAAHVLRNSRHARGSFPLVNFV
jgi:hypothetical protein